MMGVLPENTKEMYNATWDEIDEYFGWLELRMCAFSRPLSEFTGIQGKHGFMQGLKWEYLRPNAMNLVAPFDSVLINLNETDGQKLKDLIKLQKDCD